MLGCDFPRRHSPMERVSPKHQEEEPAAPPTGSSPGAVSPSPSGSGQSPGGNRPGPSPKRNPSNINGVTAVHAGKMSGNHQAGEAGAGGLPPNRPSVNAHAKNSKNTKEFAQGRNQGKSFTDAQKRGFSGSRSAPSSAGRPKPAHTLLAPFEVKMADFPELSGASGGRAEDGCPRKEHRGLNPASSSPRTKNGASGGTTSSQESSAPPDDRQNPPDSKPVPPTVSPGQPAATSWANVASQPPIKAVPKERTVSGPEQTGDSAAQPEEDGVQGKKKRKKKKKKAKDGADDADGEADEPPVYQEPPRFEDEEEFPGLTSPSTGMDRSTKSGKAAPSCNEESQRNGVKHQGDPGKEKPVTRAVPSEAPKKKEQKPEKVSGKKSKVPVQLDIGNMLSVLEKKQQSQKARTDAKPVIAVGGGLPIVPKQPSGQKKPPWQQDKIAHNPLDSTSPLVKKGKQREVPRAKKPTALKKVILKEREERKQRRLLEERGLLPEGEGPRAELTEEERPDANPADEDVGGGDNDNDDDDNEQPQLNGTDETAGQEDAESDAKDSEEIHTAGAGPPSADRPKIHSRKFREYCSQMLSKDVDECVTNLLKELVRFQDRLYQKDPMKARMKRRIVMGLREVLKHLKLRKVKCVIISPNCERIQSKGGLDEAVHTIIDTCREQGVPFIFALSRKALGRCVNKMVPVSLVGIFNYDGAQDFYHKMIELSSEARKAYEDMISSLEQSGQGDDNTQEINNGSLGQEAEPAGTPPEVPEYIRVWKSLLEKDRGHTVLNFEQQLSSLRPDADRRPTSDRDADS